MIIKNKLKKFLKLNLTFIIFIFLLVIFNGGIHANQDNDLQKKQLDIDFISLIIGSTLKDFR